MQTLEIVRQPDPDGIIRLSIRVDEAERSYRLTVTIEPEQTVPESSAPAAWPEGFLERVVGAWQGDFDIDCEGDFRE
ncbi:MAG: hypothetical protein ACREHD_26715 [Pirellulales bacterium]